MKNPLKKYIKTYKRFTTRLLSNKQSWLIRHLFLTYDLFLKKHGNTYFSDFGEDVVIQNIFRRKKAGFYVDVGCWHPKWRSNTYLLHKRGWKGINIDMDTFKIDMFNIARKNSINLCTAVSNKEEDLIYYSSIDHSAMNTLDPRFAQAAAMNKHDINYEMKKTQSITLDHLISSTKYYKSEIDLLTVDVEGYELPVLKSLNFKIYKPKVVVVELHSQRLEEVLESEIYQFMRRENYSLYSWIQPSLIFVRDGYHANSAVVLFSNATA